MRKGTEFLLAEDPQRPEIGEFLLHINTPVALIQVLSMDDSDPVADERYIAKDFTYVGPDGYTEVFQLVCMPFTDGVVEFNKETQAQLLPVLDRAWKWYSNYLKWEDTQNND